MPRSSRSPFSLFAPPYDRLEPFGETVPTPVHGRLPAGEAVVWQMARSANALEVQLMRDRPGGLALIVVLPPAQRLNGDADVLTIIDRCRPHSVLPFHPEPEPEDLAVVLRRPPEALPVDVTDYLVWRGVRVDGDTRRLIRRTLELSGELRTVSGLSRALYLSRRALGRRFLSRGLPAPSHWLQFGRVLRATIRLQTTNESLFSIAAGLGYPDGFALSNQMKRLTSVRPSTIRECLGWEWVVEGWLVDEHRRGGLHFELRASTWGTTPQGNPPGSPSQSPRRPRRTALAGRSGG
jgi:AraC-like DNA-binding protein